MFPAAWMGMLGECDAGILLFAVLASDKAKDWLLYLAHPLPGYQS